MLFLWNPHVTAQSSHQCFITFICLCKYTLPVCTPAVMNLLNGIIRIRLPITYAGAVVVWQTQSMVSAIRSTVFFQLLAQLRHRQAGLYSILSPEILNPSTRSASSVGRLPRFLRLFFIATGYLTGRCRTLFLLSVVIIEASADVLLPHRW